VYFGPSDMSTAVPPQSAIVRPSGGPLLNPFQGYFVIGPESAGKPVQGGPQNLPAQVYTRPQMTYAVSELDLVPTLPANQPPYSLPSPTIVLQRLACPYLPHNPMSTDQEKYPGGVTFNPKLPLNPYITIDYFGNVNRYIDLTNN